MRRLGKHVTFVTARRPTRTTAEDCAIRGGEYTFADRADYQTSLTLWLDAAQEGDAKAQYYVGTIYEKGPKGKPDYALAAVWYQKAAEQGHHQAAMNLGRLYEKGWGVPKNALTASKWYAEASGLGESDLSMLMNVEIRSRIQELEKTLSYKNGSTRKRVG
jgi:TPR repeat protein